MIITRTPLRVSFVGGGSDLRSFYSKTPGKVLSTSIDKYIYVILKKQIGIVESKYKITWNKIELADSIDEIEHPIVREALRLFNIDFPIEITTFSDIPAGTGLGSSSAFAVGLVHALFALKGQLPTKYELASTGFKIEVDILQRNMGKQDHFASAYGGLNIFKFNSDESVDILPVPCNESSVKKLQENLLFFFTEKSRDASVILEKQDNDNVKNHKILCKMRDLVDQLAKEIFEDKETNKFGALLHENWLLKKTLSSLVSNKNIEQLYQLALNSGASGGKLLGAGGGGFLMFYVEEEFKKSVIQNMRDLNMIEIKFDSSGSRITYFDRSSM